MFDYLRRLVRTGVAYQAGDILSKGVAVFTLPLYTRYVAAVGYGYVETLLTAVILLSIVLRLGVGEAFIRFYYDDAEPQRRDADRGRRGRLRAAHHDARGARRGDLRRTPVTRAARRARRGAV